MPVDYLTHCTQGISCYGETKEVKSFVNHTLSKERKKNSSGEAEFLLIRNNKK